MPIEPIYIPCAEEIRGESYQHCYGQPVVIPAPQEPDDADPE